MLLHRDGEAVRCGCDTSEFEGVASFLSAVAGLTNSLAPGKPSQPWGLGYGRWKSSWMKKWMTANGQKG